MLDTTHKPRDHYLVTVLQKHDDGDSSAYSFIVLAETFDHAQQIAYRDAMHQAAEADLDQLPSPYNDYSVAYQLWQEMACYEGDDSVHACDANSNGDTFTIGELRAVMEEVHNRLYWAEDEFEVVNISRLVINQQFEICETWCESQKKHPVVRKPER